MGMGLKDEGFDEMDISLTSHINPCWSYRDIL